MGYFERRKKRRPFLRLFLVALIMAGIWGGGFLYFTQMIPDDVADQARLTDGIVVLTGGSHRLNTGLTLLSEKKAQKLLISGVYRGVDLEELLSLSKRAPDELECCVDIGHEADSTHGNALETARWIAQTEFQSIRLVTADYHMPRSLLELRHTIPNVEIIAHPVFPEHVKSHEWWMWPGTASLLVGEYNKFLLVWLRQKITGLQQGEVSS